MTLIKCISKETAKIQNGTIIYSAWEIGFIATGVTNHAAPSEDGGDMTIKFNYTVGLLKVQRGYAKFAIQFT
jgi:hypothetical protein